MSMQTDLIILRNLILGKSSLRFIIGVLFSFSFSITSILCTIGIMDGFEDALKKGLKKSSGDVTLYNKFGFFTFDDDLKNIFENNSYDQYSPYIQTEGFIIKGQQSKGVLARGVELESFSKVTGLKFDLQFSSGDELIVGKELLNILQLNIGDEVALALGQGDQGLGQLPVIKRFKIIGTVAHGVYEKDSRIVYAPRKTVANLLSVDEKVNLVAFNIADIVHENLASQDYIDSVREQILSFPSVLGIGFVLRPFWSDFAHLLEAVEVEKLTIIIILQVIVVISIFNILAFMIYLNEKKSQQIFLFQALGVSKKRLLKIWALIISFIWLGSCALSIGLTEVFDFLLATLSIFQLPGDIYDVNSLYLKLGVVHYVSVFILALIWLTLIVGVGFYRMRRKSVISGLRKEFA